MTELWGSYTSVCRVIPKDEMVARIREAAAAAFELEPQKVITVTVPVEWFHALKKIVAWHERRARKKRRRYQHQKRKQ